MKYLAGSLLLLLLYASPAMSQSGPLQGDRELELWAGGGDSARIGNVGVRDVGTLNFGLRYGWILTGPHGPGILRSQLEFAVDVAPVFCVFEPGGTAYGVVLDPFVFKWDFRERRRVVPYFEFSGGSLFTNRDVPPEVSRVNFASGGATGVYFLAGKYNWSAEFRYMHISDAGLTQSNPGVNTFQMRVAFGIFRHRK
ncbi:MAG: acyloxyacyl hydrolase [Candidatus Acidiferrales bacterium]